MSLNIGSSFITLSSSWAELKAVLNTQHLRLRSRAKGTELHLFAIDDPIVYLCTLYVGNVPHAVPLSQVDNDAAVSDFNNNFLASANGPVTPRTSSGATKQQVEVREGSKVQIMTQSLCDKHTWFSKSTRVTAGVMTDTGNGLTWALAADKVLVDVTHGRMPAERKVRATYAPKVFVAGVLMTERLYATTTGGDYTINYATGRVTFFASQAGKTVTMDHSTVNTSEWYVKPAAGKKLRLTSCELQFDSALIMNDALVFTVRADVAKHPALAALWNANGGPHPAGTMISLGETVYQNKFDVVVEANGSFPVIPATPGAGARDLTADIQIFRWEYEDQASVDLSDKFGMDAEVKLENHQPCTGTYAVATFYGVSEAE